MKKQIIPKKSGLTLDKKTISNLDSIQMKKHVGGGTRHTCDAGVTCWTCDRHTCGGRCGSF